MGSEEGGNKKEATTQNTSQQPNGLVPVFYHLIGCVYKSTCLVYPVRLAFSLFAVHSVSVSV